MSDGLENLFAGIRSASYQISSEQDNSYNCISWAAGDITRWWWPAQPPFSYWPGGAPREETLQSFIQAFEKLGYTPCEDGKFEDGIEKVAIFVDLLETPTHMARQLPNGHWTSKLGTLEDIRHETLEQLEGANPAYGKAAQFLKRRIPAPS
jgi:hypothetical protein